MHSLSQIVAMNNQAVRARARRRAEDNYNRQCSYTDGFNGSVVLHSAKLRDTIFLPASKAKVFKAQFVAAAARGVEAQNHLVESYFE